MTTRVSSLMLLLLLVISFTLATSLQPRAVTLGQRGQSDDMLNIALGDGRRMFANHFFVKADVYFHSGYYPSIFEQSYQKTAAESHFKEHQHEEHHDEHGDHDDHDDDEHEHEPGMNFLGKPTDWIDSFGRHFYSSKHSHLDKPGAAREILPWLRLSADLDPQHIETYTVAAYWLRMNMKKTAEAEEFLREGLRANPTSYEILFDLGQLYFQDHHDPRHARNLWELALQRWYEQDENGNDPDPFAFDEIIANLAHLEEDQGNLKAALEYLEMQVDISPSSEAVQKHIDELKAKIAAQANVIKK